ncbi:MAG: UDP-N-acetylmuramoyl-L-alanine--D-glutamate ligase [Deltaproteobacteria bacterium]|nr:UDP-N-acetylmuramoyl-L-alanine--D-glutamate ligase [Deltaproteobacteria bacterium]
MELKGRRVLVIGLARTGVACARFLVDKEALVTMSDVRPESEMNEQIKSLAGLPIRYFLGTEERGCLDNMDYIVPSPGVAAVNPLLCEAKARGIPVLGEIELAHRFFRAPLICCTGTNGKSTTTTLIGEMLKADGRRVFVGGNLGTPFIGGVDGEWDWGVLEISSFQLEWIEHFRPRIAVLLNVTEDHLDRYAAFDDYRRAKERIFAAQTESDFAVLNRDDPLVWALKERLKPRVVSFGHSPVGEGVSATGDIITWRDGPNEDLFSLAGGKIQGVHNVENMMAAVAAAKLAGISHGAIRQSLETFPGLEHRLEFVRETDGVKYYNDSKGTNVGAVVKSLAGFSAPVILIAGGVDKGGDYGPLMEGIRRKVRRLVLFGAAKEVIARALGHLTETVIVEDLASAVRDAAAAAHSGDVVLLSPACSSFDQFRDYAERGKVFKNLVLSL